MPTYRIVTTARATIEEQWLVEARNPSEAYDKLLGGDGTLQLELESVRGDEEDRTIERMAPLDWDGNELEDVSEDAWAA